MSEKAAKTERRTAIAARRKQITADALADEKRISARELEEKRVAQLEELSPKCARRYRLDDEKAERTCTHRLNIHEPCSKCPCPGFIDAEGRDAAASRALLEEQNPELYPHRD